MLGPIGVECKSKRSSSSDLWDSWLVFSVVLMILTWHSVKLLDLRKCGDEVTWSMWLCCRNCVAHWKQMGDCCQCRADKVVCTVR